MKAEGGSMGEGGGKWGGTRKAGEVNGRGNSKNTTHYFVYENVTVKHMSLHANQKLSKIKGK